MAPGWPQDGPKMALRGPKMALRGPKMAPRWPQDGPKMAPRRLQNTRRPRIRKSAENIVFYSANATSRQCHKEQKGTKMAPRDPNMITKSPKEVSAWPEVAGRCPPKWFHPYFTKIFEGRRRYQGQQTKRSSIRPLFRRPQNHYLST